MTTCDVGDDIHKQLKSEIRPGLRLAAVSQMVASGACRPDGSGPDLVRRSEIVRDLQRVAKLMDREIEDVPADARLLRQWFGDWCPAKLGLTPAVATRVKSSLKVALELASAIPSTKHTATPLSEEWRHLRDAAIESEEARGLRNPTYTIQCVIPLIRFCNGLGLLPRDVTEETLEMYVDTMMAVDLRIAVSRDVRLRRIRVTWNKLSLEVTGWPPAISVPAREMLRLQLGEFPESFRIDLENYVRSGGVRNPDRFNAAEVGYLKAARARVAAEGASKAQVQSIDKDRNSNAGIRVSKALADVTARAHADALRLTASALVRAGTDKSAICSISDVATPEAAQAVLIEYDGRHPGKEASSKSTLVTHLLSAAERWTDLTEQHRAEFWAMHDLVEVKRVEMGAADREAIEPFLNDMDNTIKLVRLPILTFEKLERRRAETKIVTVEDAREAQQAIMLMLVCTLPVRRRTLACTLLECLKMPRRPGAEGSIYWNAESTKQKKPISAGLAEWKAILCRTYIKHYRPLLALKDDNPWLFPGRRSWTADDHLSDARVADTLKSFVYKTIGLSIRSHLWRKIFAGVLLKATGDDKVIAALLGHGGNSVSTGLYVDGLRSRSAASKLDCAMNELMVRSHLLETQQ